MTVNNGKNNAAGAREAVSNRSSNAAGARRAVNNRSNSAGGIREIIYNMRISAGGAKDTTLFQGPMRLLPAGATVLGSERLLTTAETGLGANKGC